MDEQVITTGERSASKARNEIIKEAKRIEEALLYTAKQHFVAAHVWSNFHLWIGIPMILAASVAGASALSEFDPTHFWAGVLSIAVAAMSGVVTFVNPNAKATEHKAAGNRYDSLMNKTRIFWSIDCWRDESDQVLTQVLKDISDQKDKLNQSCPQPPSWAYARAKKGIEEGEAKYDIDLPSS